MKEGLKQKSERLEEEINLKEKKEKKMNWVIISWTGLIIPGLVVSYLVKTNSRSFFETSAFGICFLIWLGILLVLGAILLLALTTPIAKLRGELRRTKRRLSLLDLLYEFKTTVSAKEENEVIEKIFKEAR